MRRPGGVVLPGQEIPAVATAQLSPTGTGTRVTWRMRLPRARKAREMWESIGESMMQSFQQSAARMQQLLAEEVAAEGAPQDLPHSHPH
jgi:carbon monoxide dehydrogenase subunit G